MKSNITGKDYRTTNRVVQLKIDECFAEKVIPADDSVRHLDQIVEEMDLTPLMRAYSELGRKPATAPSTMLKVLLYANMEWRMLMEIMRVALVHIVLFAGTKTGFVLIIQLC